MHKGSAKESGAIIFYRYSTIKNLVMPVIKQQLLYFCMYKQSRCEVLIEKEININKPDVVSFPYHRLMFLLLSYQNFSIILLLIPVSKNCVVLLLNYKNGKTKKKKNHKKLKEKSIVSSMRVPFDYYFICLILFSSQLQLLQEEQQR